MILMSIGVQKGFIRFAGEYDQKNLMGKLIGSMAITMIIGASVIAGVCLLLLLPFFQSLLHTQDVFDYVMLTCLTSFVIILYNHMTSYFRVKNEGRKFFIANVAVLVLLIATNFIFLRILGQGVKGVLVAQIVTYGSLWLFLFAGVVSKTGLGFSLEVTKRLLWFSFPLMFAMLWDLVTSTSAIYFLGYFYGLEQVAIYSLGMKIAQISGMILILPFQLAYEPFVYGHLAHPEIRSVISKLLTYLMFGFVLIAFGIVFLSRPLLSIIAPPAYSSAYTVIFLVLPGIAFLGVYYVAESLLGIREKTPFIGGFVTLSAIGSLGLNYLLISLWGIYGAIFVHNVTQIFIALVLLVIGMKVFPIPLEGRRLGVAGALFIFLLLFVFMLHETHHYIYYTVIPAAFCFILGALYVGNFFNEREKAAIKGFVQGIRSIADRRKLMVG